MVTAPINTGTMPTIQSRLASVMPWRAIRKHQAAATNARRLVRMDGLPAARVVEAIVGLMPLDDFVPNAAFRMAVTGAPTSVPAVCKEFASILAAAGYKGQVEPIERMAFYERAQQAYGIVATGEPRPWGNLILKKGTIMPAAE